MIPHHRKVDCCAREVRTAYYEQPRGPRFGMQSLAIQQGRALRRGPMTIGVHSSQFREHASDSVMGRIYFRF
jgi:hypothetical protein